MKQTATRHPTQHALAFGPFKLLRAQRLLLEDDVPVRLGSRALDILVALVERAGELVSNDELMTRVWPRTVVEENSLRVHMSALRKVLGDGHAGARYIINQPGAGYRFVAPIARLALQEIDAVHAAPTDPARTLPARLTRIVGRGDVVAKLALQLDERRFVTLVGPGGIGKTTVALAVAEMYGARCAGGARFIDLAPVSQPGLLPSAVAFGLGLTLSLDDPAATLSAYLRDRETLLVLDNCEHVVDAVVPLAEQLLKAAPGLRLLATSREPLRAEGEWLHRLPALELPPRFARTSAVQALAYPAVQLFVERATATVDSFELSDAEAATVGELCHRLDGNPLAIELAAARVDLFGVRGLVQQIDAHALKLKSGQRAGVARHQSLAAMLDWSYELLTDAERSSLRQLSIFQGRFTLAAAAQLLATESADTLDIVVNLADKSLLTSDASGETVYFRLLELTRTYAREKLAQSGEHAAVARRHAELVLSLMRRASDAFPVLASKGEWMEAYAWATDDVRAVLAWAFGDRGEASIGASLTAIVWPLVMQMNFFDEPRAAVERALAAVAALPQRPPELEVRLAIALAFMKHRTSQGVGRSMTEALDAALALAQRSGDARYEAEARMGSTLAALSLGDFPAATVQATGLHEAAQRARDPVLMLVADRVGAQAWHFAGDNAKARSMAERVLGHPIPRGPLGTAAGMIDHAVSMRIVLSRILWLEGLADEAVSLADEALHHASSDGASALCQALSLAVCPIALWRGDLDAAAKWVARLETEYTTHALRGGWLPVAAGIPWRLALDAQAKAIPSSALPSNKFQLDHLISVHGAFVSAEAADRAAKGDAGWCAAEILRAKGEMALRSGSPTAFTTAESLFQQALDIARRQHAAAWELRAATSLARLWHARGRQSEAQALLEPVYRRFTEGLATADLLAAASVLQ